MSWDLLVLVLSLSTPAAIKWLQVSRRAPDADHIIHRSIIRLIRANGHRFIRRRPDTLFNSEVPYPQLPHWCLSFLPDSALGEGKYLSPLCELCSAAAFGWFVWQVQPFIGLARAELLLCGAAVFIATPYAFNINNAKNMGLSFRGVGLFLGQLYLYAITLYHLQRDPWLLALALAAAFAIYLSSQFALQFLLFSAPLLCLLHHDWTFAVPPLVGAVLLFVLLPGYGSRYFRVQLAHKKNYMRVVAERYVLNLRYSIWRDWVWDFWVGIVAAVRRRKAGPILDYIYRNSLVCLIFGFPFLALLGAYWIAGGVPAVHRGLIAPIAAALLLFVSFSLRKTRFLGEPERYVEFANGFIAVAAAVGLAAAPHILWGGLAFCAVFNAAQIYLNWRISARNMTDELTRRVQEIGRALAAHGRREDVRLLSNNLQVTRMLVDGRRKVFWGPAISPKIGRFDYAEAIDEYPYLKKEVLKPILREYAINYMVLDDDPLARVEGWPGDGEPLGQLVARAGRLRLYARGGEPGPTDAPPAP